MWTVVQMASAWVCECNCKWSKPIYLFSSNHFYDFSLIKKYSIKWGHFAAAAAAKSSEQSKRKRVKQLLFLPLP